jgi:putative ATP-dependent endonuclease of the OLD family
MRITRLRIRNYRCIREATLDCGAFTAMLGANGVGKSTFLRAVEAFYSPSPRIVVDDFYGADPSLELVIELTYDGLAAEAKVLFAKYMQGETLTLERAFRVDGTGKIVSRLHGAALRNTDFQPVRAALELKDRGKTAKIAYESLRQFSTYAELPDWTTIGGVAEALGQWEGNNPESCVRERDDGQFFGFTEVAQGYLGRFTRLLYIPAVREASSDASETRGSVLSSLMDLVVRTALTNKAAYTRLQARTQALFARLMLPEKLPELANLGSTLESTLKLYVPDAGVSLSWLPTPPIELPIPTANVRLREGDYDTAVERTGHGLQRAFIMAILQQLTRVKNTAAGDALEVLPSLVLAIEEPELYQHPSRQRHLARTLVRLATNGIPGVTDSTQIMCSTHSPLFVSVDRIEDVRLLRRSANADGRPKSTTIVRTTMERLARVIWEADGSKAPEYTAATLSPRLRTVMTPWVNEGFFADVAVLVEGEDDRAALLGTAQILGLEIDGGGFAILPCGGKTCLDRPYAIFRELGIPTYVVWDSDFGTKDAKADDNHRLLRLVGEPVSDWPSKVEKGFACFETDLEATMRAEIGPEFYDAALTQCQSDFGIPKRKHAQKNPAVVARLIADAKGAGKSSATLEAIVKGIGALRA